MRCSVRSDLVSLSLIPASINKYFHCCLCEFRISFNPTRSDMERQTKMASGSFILFLSSLNKVCFEDESTRQLSFRRYFNKRETPEFSRSMVVFFSVLKGKCVIIFYPSFNPKRITCKSSHAGSTNMTVCYLYSKASKVNRSHSDRASLGCGCLKICSMSVQLIYSILPKVFTRLSK